MDVFVILKNYLVHGWFFALAHALLIGFVVQKARAIQKESQGLSEWSPGKTGITECTWVLAQFVDECEHWGRHGILVPSTDFTDRLDSRVSGLIDGISGLVNLFLVIGVAGTFVGLFDFAQAMAEQLQKGGDPTGLIGSSLSSGLAKALPVSIVGIMLTIAGHVVVSMLESGLKTELTKATQRAMYFRRQSNTSLAESIRQAMDPFRDIAHVMGERITPVIEVFLNKVEDSMARIGTSLEPFSVAVSKFNQSSDQLSASVASLKTAVKESSEHLVSVQRSRDNLAARTSTLLKKMESLEEVMSGAARDLSDGAIHIKEVAGGMAGAVKSSLGELQGVVREQWTTACGDYFLALNPVSKSLVDSTDELKRAGGALQEGFRTGIESLTKSATETWRQLAEPLMASQDQRLAELNKGLNDTNARLGSAASAIEGTSIQANAILTNGAASVVRQLLGEYESSLSQIKGFLRDELPHAIRALDVAAKEVERMRADSSVAVRQFQSTSASAQDTIGNFSRSVDKLSNSLSGIDAHVRSLGETVGRLDASLEGRRSAMSPSGDGKKPDVPARSWWRRWGRRK